MNRLRVTVIKYDTVSFYTHRTEMTLSHCLELGYLVDELGEICRLCFGEANFVLPVLH